MSESVRYLCDAEDCDVEVDSKTAIEQGWRVEGFTFWNSPENCADVRSAAGPSTAIRKVDPSGMRCEVRFHACPAHEVEVKRLRNTVMARMDERRTSKLEAFIERCAQEGKPGWSSLAAAYMTTKRG